MKFKKLTDICELIIGRTPSRSNSEYWGKGHVWVSISDMKGKVISETKEQITDLAIEKVHCRKISKGTLLLSFKLSIGKLAFAGCDLYTNEAIVALQILKDVILSPDYLYYVMKYVPLAGSNQAAMGKTLNSKSLAIIKIPIPENYDDQIRIATILSCAEKLIAKRKESIKLLDEFLKSTFLDMFGDPVRNEKEWDKKPLSKLGSINRGVSKNRPRNAPELLGGKHPLIQTGDISNSGTFITKYSQTYSEIGLKQSKLWKAGTLCITIAANIAKTGILTFDACFPDSVVGFIVNDKESNILYVHFLFSFFQRILEKNAPQAAQKNINLDILRNLKVPVPPLSLQNKFAKIVEKVESIKIKYTQSLTELENLYGSLSQRAFKGELDLSKIPVDKTELLIDSAKQSSEKKLPENVSKILKDLNTFNNSSTILKALQKVAKLATVNIPQMDTANQLAKQLAAFKSPFDELKGIASIAKTMDKLKLNLPAWDILNKEQIRVLEKSANLAKALTVEAPKIDIDLLKQHQEAMKVVFQPFEDMKRVMAQITLPSKQIQDAMRGYNETAKRMQNVIPDYSTWQTQYINPDEIEFDDEESYPKRTFTSEDVKTVFAETPEPITFDTLLESLRKLEEVDLLGYETIKEILFSLFKNGEIEQTFDKSSKEIRFNAAL